MSSIILHKLDGKYRLEGQQKKVSIIKARSNKCFDSRFKDGSRNIGANMPKVAKEKHRLLTGSDFV